MAKMTSILVVLHGTDPDSAGQELALLWARRTGAELTGLAVVDETVAEAIAVPMNGGALHLEEQAEWLAERQRQARASQEAFATKCHDAKLAFDVDLLSGVPHEIVARQVQGHDVAILDHQPVEEYGQGEAPEVVLERLIRVSPRPIVSVPKEYRPGNAILVAYDGSPQAARALFGLVGSGLEAVGSVLLMTVDKQSDESAAARAQTGIDYLRRHQVDTVFLPIVSRRPFFEIICEEAESRRCELIVMGAHGHSAVREFFFGSDTKEVIENSAVPVFLYH